MPRVALPCPRVLLECRSDLVGGSNLFSVVGEAASLVNTPTVGAQGITCASAASERIDVQITGMALSSTPAKWTLCWAGIATVVPPTTKRLCAAYGFRATTPPYRGVSLGLNADGTAHSFVTNGTNEYFLEGAIPTSSEFVMFSWWDGATHHMELWTDPSGPETTDSQALAFTPQLYSVAALEVGRNRHNGSFYWDGTHKAAAWYFRTLSESQRKEWVRRVLSRELLWPNADPTLSRCLG